jgi:hypothetical protein
LDFGGKVAQRIGLFRPESNSMKAALSDHEAALSDPLFNSAQIEFCIEIEKPARRSMTSA